MKVEVQVEEMHKGVVRDLHDGVLGDPCENGVSELAKEHGSETGHTIRQDNGYDRGGQKPSLRHPVDVHRVNDRLEKEGHLDVEHLGRDQHAQCHHDPELGPRVVSGPDVRQQVFEDADLREALLLEHGRRRLLLLGGRPRRMEPFGRMPLQRCGSHISEERLRTARGGGKGQRPSPKQGKPERPPQLRSERVPDTEPGV
ncbi:hypothetical protein KL929_002403 [Ogataea haglerorum]|nr:hypothetical protein KL929_002403 [Ogataea haglerorum]